MKMILRGFFILIILFSGFMISRYVIDLNTNEQVLDEVNQIKEAEATINEEEINLPIIKEEEENIESKVGSSYELDFSSNPNQALLELNNDFIGWLEVGGTAIDYPIVKTNNNSFYLDHDFNKEKNIAGSIYMDYRNIGNAFDDHILIYGHNMKNGSMFHNLRYYKDENFFEENNTILFSNLYETTEYEIFSVYSISAEDYRFELSFDTMTVSEYIEELKGMSLYQNDIPSDDESQILSLITCTYEVDDGRFIVHAIKK